MDRIRERKREIGDIGGKERGKAVEQMVVKRQWVKM